MKRFAQSRWFFAVFAGMGLAGAGSTVVSIVTREPTWWRFALLALNSFLFGYHAYKWRTHGRHRQAEARDPHPGDLTISFSASGGAVDLSRYISGLSGYSIARPARSPDPGLEVVEETVPILAHRVARLRFGGDGRPFMSYTNYGYGFGADEVARCTRRYTVTTYSFGMHDRSCAEHTVPGVSCSCGWYALPAEQEAWAEDPSLVTLMVELSGRVIEHERGYRAEHQRVVECRLPACRLCGCQADVIDVRGALMAFATCSKHVTESPDAERVLVAVEDLNLPVPVTRAGRVRADR